MAPTKPRSSLSSFLEQINNNDTNTIDIIDPESASLGNGLLRSSSSAKKKSANSKSKQSGSLFTMMDDSNSNSDSEEEEEEENSEDEKEALRRDYVKVGQGSIRKNLELDVPAGDKYVGKRADRKTLLGEDENLRDDEEESGDEEAEEWSEVEGEDEEGEDEEGEDQDVEGSEQDESPDHEEEDEEPAEEEKYSEEGSEEEESESDEGSEEEEEESDEAPKRGTSKSKRSTDLNSQLRQLEEEEKELMKSLSASARAEVEKGRHVKAQISIFESLLDLRIKMQPVVTSANRLPPHNLQPAFYSATSSDPHPNPSDELHELKSELSHVITDLVNLRLHLLEQSPGFPQDQLPPNRKRKSHPNQALEDRWADLDQLDSLLTSYRNSTLDKWWAKAHGGAAQQQMTKFKAVNQAASEQVRAVLADKERLRKRTRLWRSGDRSLGRPEPSSERQQEATKDQDGKKIDAHLANTDPEIYDDTDFYSLLLKELIDSRGSTTSLDSTQLTSNTLLLKQLQDRKKKASKKNIDTKASKGRKVRYHVMDKLRNFMAPREVVDMEDGMKDELFGNLFGGVGKEGGRNKEAREVVVGQGFKLFA